MRMKRATLEKRKMWFHKPADTQNKQNQSTSADGAGGSVERLDSTCTTAVIIQETATEDNYKYAVNWL